MRIDEILAFHICVKGIINIIWQSIYKDLQLL